MTSGTTPQRSGATPHATPQESGATPPAFAASALAGVVLASVAVIPAAVRLGATGVGVVLAWVGLAGCAALWLGPLAWGLAAARGLRAALVVFAGVALASLPVALVGAVLKAATHHRPLGAATFSAVAVVIVIGSLWLCGSLLSERFARPVRLATLTVALLSLAATLVTALPALAGTGRAVALDATLCLGLLAVAHFVDLPGRLQAVPAPVARYAWVLVALLGTGLMASGASGLPQAAGELAPVPALPVVLALGAL